MVMECNEVVMYETVFFFEILRFLSLLYTL